MEKHAAPPDGSSSNPSSSSSFTTKPVASHATVSCLDKRIRPNRKEERRFFLTSAERKIALPSDSREEEIRRGANSSSKICCLRHVVAARESKKRVRPRRQETRRFNDSGRFVSRTTSSGWSVIERRSENAGAGILYRRSLQS